jgi:asparagine synthetase B (glutamine-hydrolysing)
LAARILPSGQLAEQDYQLIEERGLLVAILGRRDHVMTHGCNVLSGVIVDTGDDASWWQLGAAVPDGSFALMRADGLATEAVSDYTGSKTIWHARLGCGGFVASTCLELVVALLGDFDMDEEALGWFLSSGTCGPGHSWDRRIKPLPRNSRLHARREGAAIEVIESTLDQSHEGPRQADTTTLQDRLSQILSNSRFGDRPWALALSGGCDSRALLYLTAHLEDLTCVTWVDEFLLDQADSDLAIARRLAEIAGREHVVKVIRRPTDAATLDSALRRFVRYADGRVDNYLAYVDGMQIWDELSDIRASGLLRGDELFGSAIAYNTSQILQNMRLTSFGEYSRSAEQRELAIRHDHSPPADLLQRTGERIRHWRWRLRADYEIPTVYAALNSVRSRFTEVACPLLTGELVRLADVMAEKDLDDKALFKKVVAGMYRGVPFATRTSILKRADVQAIPQAAELVLDHLGSAFARDTLGAECATAACGELSRQQNKSPGRAEYDGIAARKRSSVPIWVRRLKRRFDSPPELHLPTLGMRSYLAGLVKEEMTESAHLGRRHGVGSGD